MKFKFIQLIKLSIVSGLILWNSNPTIGQSVSVLSPNNKINVSLFCEQNKTVGNWYLRVNYTNNGKASEVIPFVLALQK